MKKKQKEDILKESTGLTGISILIPFFLILLIMFGIPALLRFCPEIGTPVSQMINRHPAGLFCFTGAMNLLVIAVILISAAVIDRKRSFAEKIALVHNKVYTPSVMALQGVGVLAVTFGVIIGIQYLFQWIGIPIAPQTSVQKLLESADTTTITIAAISVVITAPIAEEFIYRHVLYRIMRKKLLRREAILVTALFFAAAHLNFNAPAMNDAHQGIREILSAINSAQAISLFVFAIGLQIMYEKSKSILPSILTHSAFNLINLLNLLLIVSKS